MSRQYLHINQFDLKRFNTMRIKAIAQTFCIPYSINGIIEAINDLGVGKKIIMLGSGSNVVFSKNYYDNKYLFISTHMLNNVELKGDSIFAECGTTLSRLSWFAAENSIKDYEFLEDIPGTVGGGLIMNAGTYENSMANLCKTITWYDLESRKIITSCMSDDMFSKRDSIFANNRIILSCEMVSEKGNTEEILELVLAIKKKRYLKQPRNYPSAGSVFKRPTKNGKDYYVWRLLDEIGLRGYSIGDAMVSDKHPGFIVNKGNCTGKELIELLDLCKKRVMEKYYIELETEWKII